MSNEMWNRFYEMMVWVDWNVGQLTASVCLLVLCMDFVEWGQNKRRNLFFVGGVYFLVYMGLYWIPGLGGYVVNILALTAAFFVCIWIDPGNIRTKIFLFSLFLEIRWMTASISNTVSYFISGLADKMILRYAGVENPLLPGYYFLSFCAYVLLGLLLSTALMYLVVRIIRKTFVDKQHDMDWQEFFFLMIPVVNAMAAHTILRTYDDVYELETGNFIYQTHPGVDYLWMFYYVVVTASVISVIILYQKIRGKQEEEKARTLLESQIRDMQSHICEVEKLYADIRSVRHDMRNHVEVMNHLLAQGKIGEAREYSASFAGTVEKLDFSAKTGNPVTDVILGEKMELARERNIRLESKFCFPEDMGINAFDISIVVSNALSNAIEAAGAGGYVKISSFRNKNAFLITVENSFEGVLETQEGFPVTVKCDKGRHGFGLKNIRSAAEKYHGDVQLEQKENKVILTVLMVAE